MNPATSPRLTASNGARPTGSAEAVLSVLVQLTEAVRSENEDILSRRPGINHHEYNLKKSQALLVMNRLAPLMAQAGASSPLRASLRDLRAELETNQRLLGLQLRAAQAVSDLIARAIREGQSDGTYSALPWRDDTA
jgi:hypothetical protein